MLTSTLEPASGLLDIYTTCVRWLQGLEVVNEDD